MPQKNTIKEYVPDSYYHVFTRGINKQKIFSEASDYRYFLSLLDRYLSGQRKLSSSGIPYPDYANMVELLAFCLMANHIHLLIFQKNNPQSLENFMRSLLTSYSKYFNLKYKRVGSLYESRYKAKRIDDEAYLAHISRYIHLNPRRWRSYERSSLKYFVEDEPPKWLKQDKILDLYTNKQQYEEFLREYESRKMEPEEIKNLLADR